MRFLTLLQIHVPLMNMFRHLLILLLVFPLLSCQTTPKCGLETRAAFDVGSGSTKMKVAELNTCTKSILRTLADEQIKVDYRDALEKSPDGRLPQGVMGDGLVALKQLKSSAQAKGATHFTGVATAAFRAADNADEFTRYAYSSLEIPLYIISQTEEARLGLEAASLRAAIPTSSIVMWDIGGGSQQITAPGSKSEPFIYNGQIAAVSFKNYVIGSVQGKDITQVSTPNPLNKKDVDKAIQYITVQARKTVPEEIKTALKNNLMTVVGIGGVLAKSLPRQVPYTGNKITKENVLKILRQRTGWTDAQLKDSFAETEVTNLILVYAYMEALGIQSYQPADASLVDGLWFQPGMWMKSSP